MIVTPKLSIITINLNNALGLRTSIESVINQTSRDFEYIIIDGNSADGSIEVIKEFESKINYWISEPDTGIYNAMNKGINLAKGEYCQFLNSGDWFVTTNVVEKMLETIPECSIYYGNMLKLMPNGDIFRDTCAQGNLTMLNFYKGTLNHSTAFIKRCLFDKYGLYDETLKIVSDWKWYLIVIGLHNESVQYTNLDVTWFDMNGISNINHELEKQERQKVLKDLLPANILVDYNAHWRSIEQASRINRYKLTNWIFWVVERILFVWEKYKINSY